MDEKDILKIKNFDFASFLKDSLNDNDMNMLKLSELTNIPYWKITKQASLDRDLDFREFLIIMVTLNQCPDNLLDLMLEKPKKRYFNR